MDELMSKDFEWKTEEEIQWDEPGSEQSADLRAWLRRWWRWLGLSAILLLIVGLVIYNLLNRRVEQAEDAAAAEVLAAHALVRRAVLERDFDLFKAVMLDSDSDWGELQVDLLNVGLFLDRRPLNLKINLEDTADQEPPIVTLSPDLQTAELIEKIPYELTDDEQIARTIRLEHTFHYRRQEESWLLTLLPDDEDFWGDWQNSEEGDYVIIKYPQREESLVPFLLEEFDALVGRICQDEDIGCPFNFKLEIRLDRSPTSLEQLNLRVFDTAPIANSGRYHFSFPAPTLIGRPIDEAGRYALYQGYANWLAAVMAFRYAEGAFIRDERLIEERLAAWGMEPPPEPQQPVPLSQPIPQPSLPFPEQDILLACAGFDNMRLLRYDPRANRWSDELSGRETTYLSTPTRTFPGSLMTSLPDDSGVLVNMTNFDGETVVSRLVSWQDGQEQLWLERDYRIQLWSGSVQRQFDPTGRKIVIMNINSVFSENVEERSRIVPYILDLEACLSGSCDTESYNGFPYWSPDLSWALIVDAETQSQLTLRDERTGEEISLGSGFSPKWTDDDAFIYIRTVEQPEDSSPLAEIVAATVDDPRNGRVLVDAAEIAAVLSPDDPAMPVGLRAVVVHPDQPDWLFIAATVDPSADTRQAQLLSFQGDTGRLHPMISSDADEFAIPDRFLEDGQLLVVHTFGPNSPATSIITIPLDPAQKTAGTPQETVTITEGIFNVDWGQDGRWLLIAGQVSFRLIAPGHNNYDQTIIHDNSACTSAAWVNPPG
jgi:hypothetical protein